jgi:hypothetical protein
VHRATWSAPTHTHHCQHQHTPCMSAHPRTIRSIPLSMHRAPPLHSPPLQHDDGGQMRGLQEDGLQPVHRHPTSQGMLRQNLHGPPGRLWLSQQNSCDCPARTGARITRITGSRGEGDDVPPGAARDGRVQLERVHACDVVRQTSLGCNVLGIATLCLPGCGTPFLCHVLTTNGAWGAVADA